MSTALVSQNELGLNTPAINSNGGKTCMALQDREVWCSEIRWEEAPRSSQIFRSSIPFLARAFAT
jgi:hypothetical protein